MMPLDFTGSILSRLPSHVTAALARQACMAHGDQMRVIDPDTAVFPVKGILSIRAIPRQSGNMLLGPEVGSVGREAGICLRVGDDFEIVAQTPGMWITIPRPWFAKLSLDHPPLAALAAQCNDWILRQALHIAGCKHGAPVRVARWLLRAADAYGSDVNLPITQEMIATALGLRRTTVTLLMADLIGPISTGRMRVTIKDRTKLRERACSCCSAFGRMHWPDLAREREVA